MIDFESLRHQLPPLIDILRRRGIEFSRQGSRWFARCPLPGHKDKNPSFSIFADGLRCGCPVCGWDADVFEAIQRLENMPTAAAAAKLLADQYGIALGAPAPAPAPKKHKRGKAIEYYDYTDEAGELLYRVTRYEVVDEKGKPITKDNGKPDKTFRQARPDGSGGWVHNMDGVRYVLYRLPFVLAAGEAPVWLCEGERDVHALEAAGEIATTDAGGCGARGQFLRRGYADALRGKTVMVVPDSDAVGRERAAMIANALAGGSDVRMVSVEPHADVADALAAGVTVADLEARARPFRGGEPGVESNHGGSNGAAGRKPPRPRVIVAEGGAETGSSDWQTRWPITRGQAGNPAPVLANVIYALTTAPEWAGRLHFDEFGLRSILRGGCPWSPHSGDLLIRDRDEGLLTEWLQHRGLLVGPHMVSSAVAIVAKAKSFHPVREYLDFARAQWDGRERLPTWLSTYLGVDDPTGFAAEAGLRWMISAAARVFTSGAKADSALILEGAEGLRKSTALRILGEPWFSDEMPPMGTKEAAISCAGVWILEIAELQALAKSGSWETVKAFMSRSVDRYRPPYSRHAEDFPRQCIFAGTTNSSQYLEEREGSRRFWPVTVSYISASGLRDDRDQLWGEAAARYHRGEQWWLSDEFTAVARENAEQRVVLDAWAEVVGEWLRYPTAKHWKGDGALSSTTESVVLSDVLKYCLGIREGDWLRRDEMRVAGILRAAGYTRKKDADRQWRYVRMV